MPSLRLLAGIIGLALSGASIAYAQATTQEGIIVGQVVAAGSLLPLDGVQVSLPGIGRGTQANAEGRYSFLNVPAGEVTVRTQMIGYRTVEQTVTVTAGGTVALDFELARSVIELDEIVVTGTAGGKLRRTQPAHVGVIDAATIVSDAPVTSVSQLLQSRIPGLSITHGNGMVGASQKIRIRGSVSIALSNEPLIFIDGVRANAVVDAVRRPGEAGNSSFTGTGGQATSRLNDLNPDDIQSVEVVKGPAAATLYGADASAGVINIITKRGAPGAFRQTITPVYNTISLNHFTPPTNWATCPAGSTAMLCQGQAAGALVSDSPLERAGVFRTGSLKSLGWSGSGGSPEGDFSYFVSGLWSDETGTMPQNINNRRSARVNLTWSPHRMFSLNVGYGLMTTFTRQHDNNSSPYGWMTSGYLGSPLTVGNPSRNGWAFIQPRGAERIENDINLIRHTPSLTATFQPFAWFTHRLIVGGDFASSEKSRFLPRNDENLFSALHDKGLIRENKRDLRYFTLDYLGRGSHRFGQASQWSTDVAVGVQVIEVRDDQVWSEGSGLATNSARVVSATGANSGGGLFLLERSIGYLGQTELGYQDRLFLQVGLRIDENSSVGEQVGPVYLPKAGVSWVLSEESFFGNGLGFINTLRLRGAYGTTGRQPPQVASLQTFDPIPYYDGSSIEVGVGLLNPGNQALKPERGTEVELGFDASFLDERLGLEFTYFNKNTTDLLLQRELPPSFGFREDPFANVGEVINRGIEALLTAQLVTSAAFSWDVAVNASTLHNEIIDLGDLESFSFREGLPLSSFFSRNIRSVDVANNVAIVSDTIEYLGKKFPSHEGSFSSNMTIFGNLYLGAQLDWKANHLMNNSTALFRDRFLTNSRAAVDPGFLSPEERLRRFGPYRDESGAPVSRNDVTDAYFEKADFVRLRELSVTYSLPSQLAQRFGADRASITLAGRNLALWTDYLGGDPESISFPAVDLGAGFDVSDFFNVPPPRRYVLRMSLGF
jgi:outer membrane receptor protein involved in Fe transport